MKFHGSTVYPFATGLRCNTQPHRGGAEQRCHVMRHLAPTYTSIRVPRAIVHCYCLVLSLRFSATMQSALAQFFRSNSCAHNEVLPCFFLTRKARPALPEFGEDIPSLFSFAFRFLILPYGLIIATAAAGCTY